MLLAFVGVVALHDLNPVRAVAEAFGFNVEATSNPDGTTADVVFTK